MTGQLLQNEVKDKDDGCLPDTYNEIFYMVQKLPMKDLKITLKQKDVVDDDVVNIQFVGNEIHINRSDKDVEIIKDKKKIDIESLTKTPYINVDIILDSTEQSKKKKLLLIN